MKTVQLTIDSINYILNDRKPVIFLDSALSSQIDRYSYLFLEPVTILKTNKYNEVPAILNKIDRYVGKYWLAGFLSYESSFGLEEKLWKTFNLPATHSSNLIWFGVFENPYFFDHINGKWIPPLPEEFQPYSSQKKNNDIQNNNHISLSYSINFDTYAKIIRKIKFWIGKGHTYQVNFTFDVNVNTDMSAVDLYSFLREKQRTPYCAFINTGDEHILSFSPEMFFKKVASQIKVKPMKGTTPRGRWNEEDKYLKSYLQKDPKNLSENLMIVDLLRNDLGKICEIGSVETKRLYDVETHPTLHQMTSTIQGKIKSDIGFQDIFQNIFPSGSVTGAPKIRTMQIIRSLEQGDRGVYCGAIGYISPRGKAVFNVPIRTMQKKGNLKKWIYRVGSGIVWDSSSASEWDECKTKCKFLITQKPPAFEIFESILWNGRLVYLNSHIKRLKKSAKFFDYPYTEKKLLKLIQEISNNLKDKNDSKVRIFLNNNGDLRWDYALLEDSQRSDSDPVFLSETSVNENNIFLYHKTTHRPWYANATEKIRKGLCYDVIFFNSKGEITEGARSNVFIEKDGKLYTPPLCCGLLPGILRENIIKSKKCLEKIITIEDLKNADSIYCGNSVRGLQRVILEDKI